MFEALTPAVESLIEDVESKLDAAQESGLTVVSSEAAEEFDLGPSEAPAEDVSSTEADEPMLVIEDDEPESPGEVARQEYTRLFSSLRQA